MRLQRKGRLSALGGMGVALLLLLHGPGWGQDRTPNDALAGSRVQASLAAQHALALLQLGETDRALPFLEMAAAKAPEVLLYREMLADGYLTLGTYEGAVLAIETYQQVLAAEPDRAHALQGLKLAAIAVDEPLVVLEASERLFLRDGTVDLRVVPDLAGLYVLFSQEERGLSLFRRALRSVEGDERAMLLLNMAALHESKGDRRSAAGIAAQVRDQAAPGSPTAKLAAELFSRWTAAP